ncbi:hypothetical protein FACS189485_10760 [Spirochaetia bacterium]|nr:hypothetical protein FACS189485_10760 [Spirochaetia bacterium]
MGSTRFHAPYFLIFLSAFSLFSLSAIHSPCALYAQSETAAAPGVLVGTEVQNIEKILGTPGLPGSLRHENLVNLARLYELSGNIEGAAAAWTSAAAANPVNRDDLALIKGAACYVAMGEWEKAEEAVKTVLLTGWDKQSLLRARLLAAQIGAFRFAGQVMGRADGVNGIAALSALLEEGDYGEFKASIYYTLWKTSGADTWKDRLIAEFPRSPEGRIAAAADSGAVSAAPTAMWLLLPGREGIATAPAAVPSAPIVSPVTVPAAPPVPSVPAPAATSVAPAASGAGINEANGTILQTGLFGREANAQAMADRLRASGFTPIISPRSVNGADYWAVSVPAGPDMGATILQLKNAGVESFPVFN